jgi:O-succinylbenzoate synthase
MQFGKHVSCAAIEYIEEPFADLTRISEFFQETLIPVALDESMGSLTFAEVKAMDGVDYVVLKPMMLGGMEKTWQMMRDARAVAVAEHVL